MAKDPAFLFYPNDWLGGTLGMTLEQKGAYIELLMLQFNRGHMTKDMIGHVLGQEGGRIFGQIKNKFQIDENGNYFNARLEEEQNKRKSFVISRKNNKEGKNQYTKKEGHMRGQMTSHMENENENRNISEYRVRVRGYGGKGKRAASFVDLEKNLAYFTEDGTVFQELGSEQRQLLEKKELKYYEIFEGEIF